MKDKIGIYICECGSNIKDHIDIDQILRFAQDLNYVSFAKSYGILCSEEGKALINKDIKSKHLTKVIVAGCSPKEHERMFWEVLQDAGLNPFLLQMANIREQCAWVHEDRVTCTNKAKAIIYAAIKRVLHHEPLEIPEIQCQPDVLVLGAGIAGINAALTLAKSNRKVYLVEKSPFIGGKSVLYETLFPDLECATCFLGPMLDEVLNEDCIELLTMSQVQEVLGFFGNFIVQLETFARFVDETTCIGCGICFDACPVNTENEYNEGLDHRKAIFRAIDGILPNVPVIDKKHCLRFNGRECDACAEACPFNAIRYDDRDCVRELNVGAIVIATGFDLFDPRKAPQYGYGRIENIYTSLEFERILSNTGPTGGKILLQNEQSPQSIALVHCVGSRTSRFHEYCSGICCNESFKLACMIQQHVPEVSIIELHSDLCLHGKTSHNLYKKLNRVEFLRMKEPDSIEIQKKDGKIAISYTDVHGKIEIITSDMVILASAIEAANHNREIANIFHLPQDVGGFFKEENATLASVSTPQKGIYIAGCAQGLMDIKGAILQGQAAAGLILSSLKPEGKLKIEPMTAEVNERLCSSCGICVGLCPHGAIQKDGRIVINDILCQGCGICTAACPSSAIDCKHFTDEQIHAEIEGIINESF